MESNRDQRSEAYLGQSTKKCTTEKNVAARRVRACHEMPVTSQDHLSVLVPQCGGTPSVDGGLNKSQLIGGSPAGVPRFTDCSGDRRIEVLKRHG